LKKPVVLKRLGKIRKKPFFFGKNVFFGKIGRVMVKKLVFATPVVFE